MGVPWNLCHPSRLTVLAIAGEAPDTVFYVLRAAQARNGAGRGSPPARPWLQPDRQPGCGQQRLNPSGNRPAAETGM